MANRLMFTTVILYISVVTLSMSTSSFAGNFPCTARARKKKAAKTVVIFGVPLREINERGLSRSLETKGPASTASTLSLTRQQIRPTEHDNQDEEAHEETMPTPKNEDFQDQAPDEIADSDDEFDCAKSSDDADQRLGDTDEIFEIGPLNFEDVALGLERELRGTTL